MVGDLEEWPYYRGSLEGHSSCLSVLTTEVVSLGRSKGMVRLQTCLFNRTCLQVKGHHWHWVDIRRYSETCIK